MSDKVEPIPAGYEGVTPYLVVTDAAAAIEFYKKAFGAQELLRMPMPDGKRLMHAEIKIAGAPVMLADEFPEFGSMSPTTLGASPVTMHLYVEDVDAAFEQAVAAGATVTMPPADMFWGDRFGKLSDPFGHIWSLATHVKDPTPEELEEGRKQAFSSEP